MDPNNRATGKHSMGWIAWILLRLESFHSLMLLSLFVGEAHLVPFSLFHFSSGIAGGTD